MFPLQAISDGPLCRHRDVLPGRTIPLAAWAGSDSSRKATGRKGLKNQPGQLAQRPVLQAGRPGCAGAGPLHPLELHGGYGGIAANPGTMCKGLDPSPSCLFQSSTVHVPHRSSRFRAVLGTAAAREARSPWERASNVRPFLFI